MTPQETIKRFSALESQRKTVEQTWEVIERFVAPYRGKFFRDSPSEHGIEWSQRQIYDATAVMAHQSLASSLHGSLTNPSIRWFEMAWRRPELRDSHETQVWLENAGKKVYDTLQDSNFNLEINETYRDLTSFGTSFLLQEPNADFTDDWDGINFTSVPIKEAFFEPDAKGQCKAFYRRMRWKASQIIDKFGAENCPDAIISAAERASDEQFEIIFAVWHAPEKDANVTRLVTPENRPYPYQYVLRNGGHVFKRGGYYEMPAYAPRWLTTSESVWGNSPSMVALADILSLNQLVELQLKALEKVVDPTILVDERATLSDLNLGPGEVNSMRDIDRIRPFESAARFDVSQMKVEDLRAAINRYFFIDQLELKESPAMTATEVQVRYELMQRLLAATLSRLRHDLLDPLVQRTFNLLLRSGELGTVPEGVENADYDVEYIGPLSRSQRFDQSASLERWITQLQLIAQLGPEAEQVLAVPDWDKVARMAAKNLNLPTELTRDARDVEADMQSQRDQQARQAQSEAAANEARAAKDIVQAEQLRGGNPNIAGI